MTRSTQGFSLVEVMTVVMILGVLAAIGIPNYVRMQDRAKEGSVKSNARAIMMTVEDYWITNDGSYPADHTAITADMFPGGVFPANPFTGMNDAIISADGWDAGDEGKVGYLHNPLGNYLIEGYGKDAVVIAYRNQ